MRSRRLAPAGRPGRPDLRRTLRRLVKHEGPMIPLAFADRRLRRRPLLILADVSGSMERYTDLLLHFIHGARGRLGRVEAFVFSTRLTRITRQLRGRDPNAALAEVGQAVHDWSGGTRIGESLRTFNRNWSRQVGRGGPIALVISDGWDRGSPQLLQEEMARFARSVHRVVWLNPLAGQEGYQPEARGMRTVLPYVDQFLPAANLSDLAAVIRLLESMSMWRHQVRRR
ncbi:MAG: VWA domain-containing protein [Actinomycetota bacterium]|nr:VWA domain-containing protein [Actinomycetota bacterium]